MTSKLIIVISLFFAVGMVAAAFSILYQAGPLQLAAVLQFNQTACENIDTEQGCYDASGCEGIYAPSCQGCNDVVFQGCQKIPAKVASETSAKKQACFLTGGSWYQGQRGNFCLCPNVGTPYTFDDVNGCQPQ